jgi:hypothetical protein
MPCNAWLTVRGFHPVGKALAELVTPAPDRLVRHGHASLEEQFFDVTQTQLEAKNQRTAQLMTAAGKRCA